MTNKLQLFLIIGIAAIALVVALVIFGVGRREPAPEPVTLEFWGTDEEDIWKEVIGQFKDAHQNFTINYIQFPQSTYEETLINRMAEGRGPDVFLLPNTSVFKHKDKIFPLPANFEVSRRDFESSFVDITANDLMDANDQILGVPLFVDTLALIYNKDILNTAGISSPPKNWEEVTQTAERLTKSTPAKDINISGAALGTFVNVERAFELISSLMLQNGDEIIDKSEKQVLLGQRANEAVRFYTSFADPNSRYFSWTARMKDSFTAFSEGNTAIIFGNASDLALIQAKNPHISVGISVLPQPKDSRTSITYGSYRFPTVSKFSTNPVEAWRFILGIAYGEEAKTYLGATRLPPARRDIINAGTKSSDLSVYYQQALIAKSWLVPDEFKTRNIFRDVIEQTAAKTITPTIAISRMQERLRLLIQ